MSVQILVQGKIFGAREFLLSAAGEECLLQGRSHWVSLLAEVLPRALIEELGLSKMLLGASGGGQFLLVLPIEARTQAEEFFTGVKTAIGEMSHAQVRLQWAITENLGDWTVVRKRLNEEMQHKESAGLAAVGASFFDTPPASAAGYDEYFSEEMCVKLRQAQEVSWSPEAPAKIGTGPGKHRWSFGSAQAVISSPRHTAPTDDGETVAGVELLAKRAEGRDAWGVLLADVDNFGIRLRRAQSIEEYVQLRVLYKQFFAGELEVLCSMPLFWRKVTLIDSGGADFAVYGAWDALIALARDMQRLFEMFSQENLKDFPGPEGKTITMALALAATGEATLGEVYEKAVQGLEIAKSTDKDCFSVLGRILEWKHLADAAEVKDGLTGMVREFGVAPEYLRELCGIYRETRKTGGAKRMEKPWRFHRRLNRILGSGRTREFQKARTSLIADLVGKNPAHVKLRPSGRVALEWARLLAGNEDAA